MISSDMPGIDLLVLTTLTKERSAIPSSTELSGSTFKKYLAFQLLMSSQKHGMKCLKSTFIIALIFLSDF